MAKSVKILALLLVAALCVTAGYLEMNERYLGVNNDAFLAFAANASNGAPAATVLATPTDPGDIFINATMGAQTTAITSVANGSSFTSDNIDLDGDGTCSSAELLLTWENATGVDLPTTFNMWFPVVQYYVNATADSVVPFVGPVSNSTTWDGYRAGSLTVYKYVNATLQTMTYTTGDPTLGTTPTDGQFAIFRYVDPNGVPNSGDEALVWVDPSTNLSENGNYCLVAYVQDNGPYDADATAGQIQDPPAGGALFGGGGGVLGGDSDDNFLGCVANPAATLSVEWLLLLIAPAVYLIRRRFK